MQSNPAPVNPLPPVVWALFFLIAGVEAVFQWGMNGFAPDPGAIGWRSEGIAGYGFSGVAFDRIIELGEWKADYIKRFFTYPFVHGGITQVAFSGVILLAMGKMVGEAMGQFAVLALFFGGAVFGAAIYGLLTPGLGLIGAFPSCYALIGGYTYLIWLKLGAQGEDQMRAFSFIAFLMGIQLFFAVFFQTGLDWIADLGGFVSGFLLSFVVVPGGFKRLLARMRQRD